MVFQNEAHASVAALPRDNTQKIAATVCRRACSLPPCEAARTPQCAGRAVQARRGAGNRGAE